MSDAARIALACLDLTSLKDDDSEASIEALAARAATPFGAPAALCVWPRFVATAKRALAAQGLAAVKVATVVNFPRGSDPASDVARQITDARAAGADEIDAVLPYAALRAGDAATVREVLAAVREASGALPLKVILETGELTTPALIRQASELALHAGADFLKTSTGKVAVNATPEAVAVMLEAIAARGAACGLKVAGGVANLADVERYLALAAPVYAARGGLNPATLRFGASSLLPVLLAALLGDASRQTEGGY